MSSFNQLEDIHSRSEGNLLSKLSKGNNYDEKKTKPSPMTATFYFFILSIFYIVISTILIYTSVNNSNTELALNIIFVLLLVLGLYFINVETIRKLCGEGDDNYIVPYTKVATTTFVPWTIVFGTTFFLLELFPGWVRPFSNTLGYAIINFLGAEKEFNSYLKTAEDIRKENQKGNKDLATAIGFVNKNTSMFINEFSPDNLKFNEAFEQLKNSGFLKKGINEDTFQKILYKFVLIKHTIGKGTWYILAGTVIAAISYNILLDIECQKSNTKIKSDIDQIYNSADKLTGTEWRLLMPLVDDNGKAKLLTNTPTNSDHIGFDKYAIIQGKRSNFKYVEKKIKDIALNESTFTKRFNTFGDATEPRGIPIFGQANKDATVKDINWGGSVTINDRDKMIYGINKTGFVEGNYIKVDVNSLNIIFAGKKINNLYYEVID